MVHSAPGWVHRGQCHELQPLVSLFLSLTLQFLKLSFFMHFKWKFFSKSEIPSKDERSPTPRGHQHHAVGWRAAARGAVVEGFIGWGHPTVQGAGAALG